MQTKLFASIIKKKKKKSGGEVGGGGKDFLFCDAITGKETYLFS